MHRFDTKRVRAFACAWACLMAGARVHAAEPADALFPFVLPWDDASPGAANLSDWLPKPAGKFGHVRSGPDGPLYAGDERIRFFGVDLSFGANLPTHADAEKVAARLAKFGVNIVRFHIMDMRRCPDGLLARSAANTSDLDPEGLDRLDYFVAQLARSGIYANVCLLNYRPLCAADGLPQEIEQPDDGPFQRRHVVGFFDGRVLDAQKTYARNLLTHRNAYTDHAYADDPAVAFVEINNENGLIHAWLDGQVDRLAELFQTELATQWNQWLRRRYGSTANLRQAWAASEQPLGGELLSNGDFVRQTEGWTFECRRPDAEAAAVAADTGPDAFPVAKSVELRVAKPGPQSWFVRFEQAGFAVREGGAFTVSFWARADQPCTLHVGIEQTHEPWHVLSSRKDVPLTAQWKWFCYSVSVGESDARARLVFDPPMQAGSCWLAGVSLRPGGVVGLGANEGFEGDPVPAFAAPRFQERSADAQRDWMRFLWETENDYWQTMYRFLKDELSVRALIIGTVVGCSTPNLMAKMDCLDAHAYWQHPVFPGRPWDPANWFVRNETMVNDCGGVLPGLALRRVQGKPFCVTEYGNPAPNTYVAEGHLLRAAYAALQDWDYISASRYSHSSQWDLRRIDDFFDIHQHPTKMVTLIPAAALFLRGDVQAARELVVAELDRAHETDLLRGAHAWDLVHAGSVGVSRETALVHRVALATEGGSVPADALWPEEVQAAGDSFASDTGQLLWDLRTPKRGTVTVNAARSKAVIGFGGGKRFELGEVVIEPGPTCQDGWSAVTVTAMTGDFGAPPCRMLVTATGKAENTQMGWKNAEKSSVGKDWGEAPTLAEGVPAKITLPFSAGAVRAWPLNPYGQRGAPMTVSANADGKAVVALGPQYRTLWYEVEVR